METEDTNILTGRIRSKVDAAQALLIVTAFLGPLFGGYVATDTSALPHGLFAALSAALGGSDAPVLSHTLIAIPMLLGMTLVLVRRKVLQVPKQIFTCTWVLFFFFLGLSILLSEYRYLSLVLWLEWLCFAAALFAAVAVGGRRDGPVFICWAIAASTLLVGLKCVLEYGSMRSVDPSWRVFGGWVNPNATAAILLLGLFAALGLCQSQERLGSLFSGIAASLLLFAIVLTGSKGAVSLALPMGLLALGLMQTPSPKAFWGLTVAATMLGLVVAILFVKNIGWLGLCIGLCFFGCTSMLSANRTVLARVLSVFCFAGVLIAALGFTTPKAAGPLASPTPIARVGQGAQTQEQSSAFRLNLWKSAAFLIEKKPVTGYGLGSYRNESARAGLTTTTIFSHNVYLQIWAEAGFLPFTLLLVGLGLWFRAVVRHRETLPSRQLTLLSGVVGACVCLMCHSLVDSDLYYFGIGMSFFLLLGLGLSLSSDAVAPEIVLPPIRLLAVAGCVGLVSLLLGFSGIECVKAVVREDLWTTDGTAYRDDVSALGWLSGVDGEASYLLALGEVGAGMVDRLRLSYELSPTDKTARLLATTLASSGQLVEAETTLKDALVRDPNNLKNLSLLMKIQMQSGDEAGSLVTARRLIAIEQTPYFLIRSIPESIPTETYDARLSVLAPHETDIRKKVDLLAQAVRGYLAYADMKIRILSPNAARQNNDENFKMPGYDSVAEANKKLSTAIAAAKEAAAIYRNLGNSSQAAEMDNDSAHLAAALAA